MNLKRGVIYIINGGLEFIIGYLIFCFFLLITKACFNNINITFLDLFYFYIVFYIGVLIILELILYIMKYMSSALNKSIFDEKNEYLKRPTYNEKKK